MYWFLFLTFLIYPAVSAKVFAVLPCEDFEDGSSFLKADYSLDYQASQRGGWVLFTLIMIAVYPLGIPAMYFAVLYRQRKELNPTDREIEGIKPDFPGYDAAVLCGCAALAEHRTHALIVMCVMIPSGSA